MPEPKSPASSASPCCICSTSRSTIAMPWSTFDSTRNGLAADLYLWRPSLRRGPESLRTKQRVLLRAGDLSQHCALAEHVFQERIVIQDVRLWDGLAGTGRRSQSHAAYQIPGMD